MAGYIKMNRDALESVLYCRPVVLQTWLFLCVQARYVKTVQDGIEILPGQLLTSVSSVAKSLKQTDHKIRCALETLEKMELIARANIRNRYSLITVISPDELQGKKQTQIIEPITAAESSFVPRQSYGTFKNVYLSTEEKQMLHDRSRSADSYIERLSAYKRRTNKTYSDDLAVLCEWISKDEISQSANKTIAAPKQKKENTERSSVSDSSGMNTNFMTSPASYDLELAERIARTTVPTLRKRKR